ncbi:MAG TPA: sigma-70 family RNA polymerase sigma factor [Gemmataceae bacterium]|nr:sigma-70 family RNA polymerase sigma factor [Gemmataceae bacterium]
MPRSRIDSILGAALRSLRREACTDAELLTRFLDLKEESAFETLVRRHAPAVRAACRSWLRSECDIDDAAQATFLILVQRGRSIRDRAAVGRWLYGVAVKVARRLRQQRKSSQPLPADLPGRSPVADDGLRDLLAEEIARLPEKYRLPVQLCYVAGLTTADAAQRLGWPKGTVLTRLAWARERLQRNLTRRGVAPGVLAGLLLGTAVPAVNAEWLRVTSRAAMAMLKGESPVRMGVSGGTVSLMEGVVRAMFYERVKFIALASLLAVGLAGFGIGHWASASNGSRDGDQSSSNEGASRSTLRLPHLAAREKESDESQAATKGNEPAKPAVPGRRREAVIRLPQGTFTKEVDAAPYGHGRLTWTYEEDRVLGVIEASVMGGEVELATEAEISLSSNGTIYGLITSVKLNHLRLPDNEEFAQLKVFSGLWTAVEPLVNEVLIDLPFSYQFRVQGDRLVISNFRILLAGPNPLGKLGGLVGGLESELALLAYFQGLGLALEGTYNSDDVKEKTPAKKRQRFIKPAGRVGEGWPKFPSWPHGSRSVSGPMTIPAQAAATGLISTTQPSLPGAAIGATATPGLPGASVGTSAPPGLPGAAIGTQCLPH